jgi:protein disulfide-isomerase A6
MVAFVAPWCGHCKALAPEYTSAASSLSPLIPFYAVDCDVSANKPLCAQYDIKGFPTIKACPRALKGAVKDYGGGRKAGELVEYAKTLVPDRVKKLRVSADAVDAMAKDGVQGAVDAWLRDKRDMPHVLLIHPTQPSIPFLWKVLSHRMSSRVS